MHLGQRFLTVLLSFLLQKAKEILTESNIPHGNCVICLYGFKVRSSTSDLPLIFLLRFFRLSESLRLFIFLLFC